MKPLYIRIRDEIVNDIASQALEAGTQLQSEGELADRFGCARMTVAKALQGLVEQGLIERRRGVGTFVADRSGDGAASGVVDTAGSAAQRDVAAAQQGAELAHLDDSTVKKSTQMGAEFFCMWSVYNEIRRLAGGAAEIAHRTGFPRERVELQLQTLVSLGHIEREVLDDDLVPVRYSSVRPAPYASIQKTMGAESELHSRNVALEKTREHIVSRFDEERAGRTDFDYYTINAPVVADDVALNELQAMLLSWIELHRSKRKDVPMTHITFLTTPVHPRDWTRSDDHSDVVLDPGPRDAE